MHENHKYVFHLIQNLNLFEEFYNDRFDYDQLEDKLKKNSYRKYRTFYEYYVFQFQVDVPNFFVDNSEKLFERMVHQ